VVTPGERIGLLLDRWESVDGTDDLQWRRARRSTAVGFIVEQLGIAEVGLDPGTTAYLEWLADWDAPTIVDTIAYIEFLAGRHGAAISEVSSYLDWLAGWDAPTVTATVRLAQLARDAGDDGVGAA
jgi:hypothetical protein